MSATLRVAMLIEGVTRECKTDETLDVCPTMGAIEGPCFEGVVNSHSSATIPGNGKRLKYL